MEDVREARARTAVAGKDVELVAVAGEVLADVDDVSVRKAAPQEDGRRRGEEVEAPRADAREGVGGPVVERRILSGDCAGVWGVAKRRVEEAVVRHHADSGEEEALPIGIHEPPAPVLGTRGAIELGGIRVSGFGFRGIWHPAPGSRNTSRLYAREVADDAVEPERGAAGGDVPRIKRVAPAEEELAALRVAHLALDAFAVKGEAEAVGAAPLPGGASADVGLHLQRGVHLRGPATLRHGDGALAGLGLVKRQIPVVAWRLEDGYRGGAVGLGGLSLRREGGLNGQNGRRRHEPRHLEGWRLLMQRDIAAVHELATQRMVFLPRRPFKWQDAGLGSRASREKSEQVES